MREEGSKGEDLAVATLKQKGFSVVERNVRFAVGEIDIVAQKGDILYFFEVKARGETSLCRAIESVTRTQQKRIARAASLYLLRYEKKEQKLPIAFFGVVAIESDGTIEVIEDAFDG